MIACGAINDIIAVTVAVAMAVAMTVAMTVAISILSELVCTSVRSWPMEHMKGVQPQSSVCRQCEDSQDIAIVK